MSGKKTSNLRNALREMRVSEPMRLKNGPTFRPPEPPTQDRKEVLHSEAPPRDVARDGLPQNEEPAKEGPQSQVAQSQQPQNEPASGESPRTEATQSEGAHRECPQFEAPQLEESRVEGPQTELTQSEAARTGQSHSKPPGMTAAHSEVVHNEAASRFEGAQLELPQSEQSPPAKAKESSGESATSGMSFFRLSDRAFSYPQLQRLSGDCFRLFLWMSSRAWRYLKSDGTLRASVGFIETHTAMSHATISRGLKTLREEALIRLIETDYKRGNVWSVSPVVFAGCGPENLPPRSEAPQNEVPRNGASPPSKRDRSSLTLREKPPQNEVHIRSIKNSENLSQECALLYERIEKISAPEKRKNEKASLDNLLTRYPAPFLVLAAEHVERHGVLKSGEKCHSLFRYLAVAIEDVIAEVRRKSPTGVAPVSGIGTTSETKPDLDSEQQRARDNDALLAFESELRPEERDKVMTQMIQEDYTWGYIPSRPLLTRLAALRWFSNRESACEAVAG